MITKKGWQQALMMSLFEQEATYGAGVSMVDANACAMKNFEVAVEYADSVVNDRDEVSGTEHGTSQEIIEKRVNITYTEAKAKPNTLIGLAALVLGSCTPTKDGSIAAWKHKIVPVTVGTGLPSIQLEHLKGGIQTAYRGLKGNTLTIAGEAGGLVSVEAALVGSGYRVASDTVMTAAISESWLKMNQMKIWLESGATISLDATLLQGAQNISSGDGTSLDVRLQ
ncbi:MAG: hypothetical protein PHE72_14775, partial [candidate division Zixibacteria bacterium]|nr:hypothetical protein [candidate division Zixibacteria bacterium]